MGAGASAFQELDAETYSQAKAFYEAKANEGLDREQIVQGLKKMLPEKADIVEAAMPKGEEPIQKNEAEAVPRSRKLAARPMNCLMKAGCNCEKCHTFSTDAILAEQRRISDAHMSGAEEKKGDDAQHKEGAPGATNAYHDTIQPRRRRPKTSRVRAEVPPWKRKGGRKVADVKVEIVGADSKVYDADDSQMVQVFVYGKMCAEVVESASKDSHSLISATLTGYQLYLAPGSETPFIVRTGNPDHQVKGTVIAMRRNDEKLKILARMSREAVRKIAGTMSRVVVNVTVNSAPGSEERVAPSSEEVSALTYSCGESLEAEIFSKCRLIEGDWLVANPVQQR